MPLKKVISFLFPASALCLFTLSAQAQLVADDFELRDGITLGSDLTGETT